MPAIRTYCRIRPAKEPSPSFELTEDDPNVLKVIVPTESATGLKTDSKMQYNFKFDRVFGIEATQEDVFATTSQAICDRFLEGYNGTIFAYGQTGSGKTHTIEGGTARFDDRGLLPRCLGYIYAQLGAREQQPVSIHVTYLEIYNDSAFDLLNAASGVNARLPKVSVQDRGKSCVIHNLSVHGAPTEDVATNLLFIGRTNRSVAKTSMNMQSSRSHSVFAITMKVQQPGSEIVVESKLNIVDLAGSERVHKSNAAGSQLTEAKHINLSLHYLESVIVALQKGGAGHQHVPYRNSLLTKLLRDSLGGNCLTVMIATVSVQESNKYESVSTCRFAQRVALVDNDAHRNEVLDDQTLIKRLRRRVAELQAELAVTQHVAAMRSGDQSAGSSPVRSGVAPEQADRAKCETVVKKFVSGKLADPLQAIADAASIRVCFELLRAIILGHREEMDSLQSAVQAGELNAERLRDLQSKFGVTRARLRNIESSMVAPSGYGTSRHVRQPSPPKRREDPLMDEKPAGAVVRDRRAEYEMSRRQTTEQRKARKHAQQKLVQLVMAEDDTVLMLQELTERLARQRDLVEQCEHYAPHRAQSERVSLRQLQQEQQLLSSQLAELRAVRTKLEDGLGVASEPSGLTPRARASSADPRAVRVPPAPPIQHGPSDLRRTTPSSTMVGAGFDSGFGDQGPKLSRARAGLPPSPCGSSRSPARDVASPNTLQRDLERREEATLQKLTALKQHMARQSSSGGSERILPRGASGPPAVSDASVARAGLMSRYAPATSSPSSEDEEDEEDATRTAPHGRKGLEGRTSVAARVRVMPLPASFDRPQPGPSRQHQESQFMGAVERQKSRVELLRRTIRAATVIQRAWRRFVKRRDSSKRLVKKR